MYGNKYLIENNNRENFGRSYSEDRYYRTLGVNSKYEKFSNSVRNYLVSEAVNSILSKVLEEKSTADKEYGKVLCEHFVDEMGSFNLIKRFEKESCVLAEMALLIKESYDNIMCKIDKNDELTFCIKQSDKKSFYDNLEGLDTDKIVEKINARTCDAAAEFVQNNINDKLDMEELANKTKEKIDNIKADSAEKKDSFVKEYTMYAKSKLESAKLRKKNIYEQMVLEVSTNIMKNEELLPKFINESGKLNMESVVDKVDVMYRFLETVNTARIYNVNESYIKSVLKSIK